ncbi:MAG TPA: ABC transporter ATP-binding protein [Planctomycetes bacterium]|nr:ABC transporter ATP-binding protein [Planctomycetota bacterium]
MPAPHFQPAEQDPPPVREELVRLDKVKRIYRMGENIVRALDGVDLSIRRGQYWSIIGRSGSGKSTLLNVLGCLDRPSSGEYYLGGTNVSELDDDALSEIRGQRIGFIFQSFNLIPQLTVLENLEVPLFYQEHEPKVAKERAERYADRVGLKDRLHHRPNELSGGQQQRVAIARALMNEPLILLADEATGNLDSKTEMEILTLLDELHEEGMTVIMVTHSDKVADRAGHKLELRDGKILQITHHKKEDL